MLSWVLQSNTSGARIYKHTIAKVHCNKICDIGNLVECCGHSLQPTFIFCGDFVCASSFCCKHTTAMSTTNIQTECSGYSATHPIKRSVLLCGTLDDYLTMYDLTKDEYFVLIERVDHIFDVDDRFGFVVPVNTSMICAVDVETSQKINTNMRNGTSMRRADDCDNCIAFYSLFDMDLNVVDLRCVGKMFVSKVPSCLMGIQMMQTSTQQITLVSRCHVNGALSSVVVFDLRNGKALINKTLTADENLGYVHYDATGHVYKLISDTLPTCWSLCDIK